MSPSSPLLIPQQEPSVRTMNSLCDKFIWQPDHGIILGLDPFDQTEIELACLEEVLMNDEDKTESTGTDSRGGASPASPTWTETTFTNRGACSPSPIQTPNTQIEMTNHIEGFVCVASDQQSEATQVIQSCPTSFTIMPFPTYSFGAHVHWASAPQEIIQTRPLSNVVLSSASCSADVSGQRHLKRQRSASGLAVHPHKSMSTSHSSDDYVYKRSKAHKGRGIEQDYICAYCKRRKTSSSGSADGRVRIRCECGGMKCDGKSRMHASWVPVVPQLHRSCIRDES